MQPSQHIPLNGRLKLTLKNYIPLETAAIFFLADLFLEKLGVCHDWFHLHELTRAARSERRELQNEKLLPIAGLELTTPDHKSYV